MKQGFTFRALAIGFAGAHVVGCAVETDAPELASETAAVTFDWGSDCSSGDGAFSQFVPQGATVTVGEIPVRKRDIRIRLASGADVDVQLVDKQTGAAIVGWPSGMLSGAAQQCTTYHGVQYCYSGYNGDGTGLGNEWIEVHGDTNRPLVMRAYGYTAGTGTVSYAWSAVPTCNEVGSGAFSQYVPQDGVATVGDIPVGKVNVLVRLAAATDLDVQLFDGAVPLVRWPDGHLSGAAAQALVHEGMTITWSGYNGDGTGPGNEFIRIDGEVTRRLTMKVYGYAAGTAAVSYEWGLGAGAVCGSLGLPACQAGLTCKNGDTGDISVDRPGTCHTETWCESEASAADDCAALPHIAVPGRWGCEEFQCTWRTGPMFAR